MLNDLDRAFIASLSDDERSYIVANGKGMGVHFWQDADFWALFVKWAKMQPTNQPEYFGWLFCITTQLSMDPDEANWADFLRYIELDRLPQGAAAKLELLAGGGTVPEGDGAFMRTLDPLITQWITPSFVNLVYKPFKGAFDEYRRSVTGGDDPPAAAVGSNQGGAAVYAKTPNSPGENGGAPGAGGYGDAADSAFATYEEVPPSHESERLLPPADMALCWKSEWRDTHMQWLRDQSDYRMYIDFLEQVDAYYQVSPTQQVAQSIYDSYIDQDASSPVPLSADIVESIRTELADQDEADAPSPDLFDEAMRSAVEVLAADYPRFVAAYG